MKKLPESTLKEMTKGPLGIDKIIMHSWRVYRKEFKKILYIILTVYIPLNILLALVPISNTLQNIKLHMRIGQLAEAFFGIIAMLAIVSVVHGFLQKKPINTKEAFLEAFKTWPRYLLFLFLAVIAVIGLFILPIAGTVALYQGVSEALGAVVGVIAGVFIIAVLVLLIIYSMYWTFFIFELHLNKRTIIDSLKYSYHIVKGRWWKTWSYEFVLGAIILGMSMVYVLIMIIPSIIFAMITPNDMLHSLLLVPFDLLLNIGAAYMYVGLTLLFLNFEATKATKNTFTKPTTKKK